MTDINIDTIQSFVMLGRISINDARALLGLLPIDEIETEERRIAELREEVIRRARKFGLKAWRERE